MNTPPEESEYLKRQRSDKQNQRLSRAILRFFLFVITITWIPFLFLGVHLYMIMHGLFFATVCLAPIWYPAKKLIFLISGLRQEEIPFLTTEHKTWQKIFQFVLSLPWLVMAGFGFWLLFEKGFLNLNLIYILMSK
jgi:hypothetical protein